MPYADLDFFLALVKDQDWLKSRAGILLAKYRCQLHTSLFTLIELLLVADRYHLDLKRSVETVCRLATVPKHDRALALHACDYMDQFKLTPFDALHAVSADGDSIISSDKAFDRAGLHRIPLERAA